MAFDAATLDVATVGPGITLLSGDCRTVLPTLAANSVQCVVTSPPYYGLRDYGTAQWDGGDAECDHQAPNGQGATGQRADRTFTANAPYRDTCGKCGARRIDAQIGLEATPDEFIAQMVAVFREVRRVLRDDGTLWLNLGDSYGSASNRNGGETFGWTAAHEQSLQFYQGRYRPGHKPKDLMMMPARVALALQADGWWLRSAIVWAKPNPMPESVTDRPTSAYEMVYLLAKQTTGWAATCKCDAPTQPCTVLDPFAGAGTALLVADRLQRNAIGIELNTAYTTMAMERCRADAPLFSSWPPAEDPADQRLAADAMQRDLFGSGE